MEEFTASLPFDKRLYKQDIRGSIAHTAMLARTEILELEESDLIIDALQEIYAEIEEGRFHFDPADEDIHLAIERRLIEKIGPVGGKLHTARSRNDQVATDLKMYLKDEILSTGRLIVNLQKKLVELAREHQDVIMPGYSHFQVAQPILYSHYLMSHLFALGRDFKRLKCSYKRSNVLPLGSAALAGTSFPIDRQFVAEQLGFANLSENALDAVSDRDFVVDFLASANLIMIHLSRFSEDIIVMSNPRFGLVELDDAFTTGSSIMPQKKNPDVAELIRGKTGRIQGHLTAMLTTLKALPSGYNRDLQEDKEGLFAAVDTVKSSLEVFTPMISTMKINVSKMKQAAEEGFGVATDLADYLTRKGLPFREAHHLTGEIIKDCLGQNKRLENLKLEELKRFSAVFEDDCLELLKVENSVANKTSPGGTAPSRVEEQIKTAEKILTDEEKWLNSPL